MSETAPGPNPNPAGEPTAEPVVEEASPTPAQQQEPPRKRSFLSKILNRRGYQEDIVQRDRDIERIKQDARQMDPESIRTPNTTEDVVAIMSQTDPVKWRERQLEKKYKGRFWKFKAFLAGERDFSMDEDGQIKRHALNELARKGANVLLNRSTVLAGSLAIVGLLTVGVGAVAGGALLGSMAGRGVVEAWNSINGRERGLREEMARNQYRQWVGLHELALKSIDTDELEEKNKIASKLIDTFYQSSEEISSREKEILAENKIWNRRRNIGAFIGGIAGAGIGAGLSHLGEHIMKMDIDGDGMTHLVERVNGSWHYVYHSANEAHTAAYQGAHAVIDKLGQHTHVLGEGTAQVVWGAAKNLAPTLARVGGIFGALWLGRISEQASEKGAEAKLAQDQSDQKRNYDEEKKFLHERLESSGADGGLSAEEQKEETAARAEWLKKFEAAGRELPSVNEIWTITVPGAAPLRFRITQLEFRQDTATIRELNDANQELSGQDKVLNIIDLCNFGVKNEGVPAPAPEESATEATPGGVEDTTGFSWTEIFRLAEEDTLETKESYEQSIDDVMEILEGEGGVVELRENVPTIVISDLHARREFLESVLNYKHEGNKISDLLESGAINIVCVGDGMHSEKIENWVPTPGGKTMEQLLHEEMVKSFNLMKMVMELKTAFPESFHYLRGNHDALEEYYVDKDDGQRKILNFKKFKEDTEPSESEEVREWVRQNFGEDFIEEYARFEENLPLVAVSKDGKFAVSHAAPGGEYTREQLDSRDEDVSRGMRWTDNTETPTHPSETNEQIVSQVLANLGVPDGQLIIGHRPVEDTENGGLYRSQFNNAVLQINRPDRMVIGIIDPDGAVHPTELS